MAAVPLLGDTDAVRRAILREMSALTGGEMHYDTLELRLFPRPRATFRGTAIDFAGAVEGRSPAVEVRIAFFPLLAGKVRLSDIRIDQPVLEVRVEPGGAGDPFPVYHALFGPIVNELERNARGMTISISGGRIDVVYGARRLVALSDLSVTAGVSAGAIDMNVSCAADLWRKAQGRVRVAAGSLAASTRLQVTGLQAREPLDAMVAGGALALRHGAIDASFDAETDGRSTVRTALAASTSQLTIARGSRTLDLGAVRVSAEATHGAEGMAFSVRELQLGELIPQASGSLRAQPDGAAPVLELHVPALDLARLRAAALALGGDLEPVRALFAPITTGTVRELRLSAAGSDFAALAEPRALRAEARLEAAALALLSEGIVVRNGAGRFAFADATLHGSELTGHIGKSSFRAGALTVGLLPVASLRSLRATLDADLAEALAISRRMLERRGGAQLTGIESVQGRASGSIQYEARRGRSGLVVEMAKTRATGRYRDVPFPLQVSGGELRYSGDRLLVRKLAGSAGRSRVQDGAIDIALGPELAIRAASGDAVLVLDEIYPWLATVNALRPALGNVKSLAGTAAVRLARLSGSLATPAALEFEAVVQPQQVRLEGYALPAPLSLSTGEVVVTADALKLNRLAVSMADTRLTASGTIQGYVFPDRSADVDLSQTTVGQQSLDWARVRWQLPVKAMPRAPVDFASARLQWPGREGEPLLVQGKASFVGDVNADFDLAWQPGNLDLRRLAVKDVDSNVTIALKWTPAAVDLAFNGNIDSRTVGRIIVQPLERRGSIRGNLHASIDLREPRRSTAAGTLEGEGLDFLERWDVPVAIEHFRMEAMDEAVRVHHSRLRVAGQSLAVSGTVKGGRETFAIDTRVTAGNLDAAQVMGLLARRDAARATGRPSGAGWDLPIEGRVDFAADSVTYRERVLRQVAGTASLAPNRVVTEVREARLCGIALPFTAVLVPGRVDVNTRLRARGQALEQVAPCLAGERLALTGTFDLDAEFSASGPHDALLRVARGRFRAVAHAGRIQRAEAMTRILSVDQVAERLPDRLSDLRARGLEYNEIDVMGTLEGERVHVERLTLDNPSLGITVSGEIGLASGRLELQGLVAPLDTVHRVVRRVPIVGRALGTSLVVVPVSIRGNLNDPEVKVLGAAAVSATLINLMTARFLLPVSLFDPTAGKPQRGPLQP